MPIQSRKHWILIFIYLYFILTFQLLTYLKKIRIFFFFSTANIFHVKENFFSADKVKPFCPVMKTRVLWFCGRWPTGRQWQSFTVTYGRAVCQHGAWHHSHVFVRFSPLDYTTWRLNKNALTLTRGEGLKGYYVIMYVVSYSFILPDSCPPFLNSCRKTTAKDTKIHLWVFQTNKEWKAEFFRSVC